jgi:hypothetical protein
MGAADHGPIDIHNTLARLIQQRTGRLRIIECPPRSLHNALSNLLRQFLHSGYQQIDLHGKERQVTLTAISATNLAAEIVLFAPLHLAKKAIQPTLQPMVCLNWFFQSRHAAAF